MSSRVANGQLGATAIGALLYLEYAVEGHPGLAGVVKDVHALIVAAPELLVDRVVELTFE